MCGETDDVVGGIGKEADEVISLDAALRSLQADGRRAISAGPLLIRRGSCFMRLRLHARALKDFEDAFDLEPTNASALLKEHAQVALGCHKSVRITRTKATFIHANSQRIFMVFMSLLVLTATLFLSAHSFRYAEQIAHSRISAQFAARPEDMTEPSAATSPQQPPENVVLDYNGAHVEKPLKDFTSSDDLQSASESNASLAVNLAVAQINRGEAALAEKLLDRIIATNPQLLGARVARGTARALLRDLEGEQNANGIGAASALWVISQPPSKSSHDFLILTSDVLRWACPFEFRIRALVGLLSSAIAVLANGALGIDEKVILSDLHMAELLISQWPPNVQVTFPYYSIDANHVLHRRDWRGTSGGDALVPGTSEEHP
eukprot:365296-Chlamydomonas_euryale.AAC.8